MSRLVSGAARGASRSPSACASGTTTTITATVSHVPGVTLAMVLGTPLLDGGTRDRGSFRGADHDASGWRYRPYRPPATA